MPTRASRDEHVTYLTRRLPVNLYKRLKNCAIDLQPDGRATLQDAVNAALELGVPLLERRTKN